MTRSGLEKAKYMASRKLFQPPSEDEINAKLDHALVHIFNKKSFKPQQREACAEVLRGKDVLACFPTGYGKSLIYQLPAVANKDGGLTLVISPLLALMTDQVRALCDLGIDARVFNSTVATQQRMTLMNELMSTNMTIRLLFVAPEGLNNTTLTLCLDHLHRKGKFDRMVVDEAHCISSWGHQFRPAYRKLSWLKRKFELPITALTATATRCVQNDICVSLRMVASQFIGGTKRNELYYEVVNKVDDAESQRDLCKYLSKVKRITSNAGPFSGIVYCHTRDQCKVLADVLSSAGFTAEAYHAGLGAKERARVQHTWMAGSAEVVCATVSFGMGIDKSNVRAVIHWSLSNSLEGYYQEAGRAGRDGKRSYCRLYYCTKDAETRRYLLMKELQREAKKKNMKASTEDDSGEGPSTVPSATLTSQTSKNGKTSSKIGKLTDVGPTYESSKNDADPTPAPTGELSSSRDAIQSLNRMIRYCETLLCRHVAIMKHFGESVQDILPGCKTNCDVCADYEMASLNLKLIRAENKKPFYPSVANRAALPALSNMDTDLVALERYDRSLQEEAKAAISIEEDTKLSDPTVKDKQSNMSERDRLFGSRKRSAPSSTQVPVLTSVVPKHCELVEPETRPQIPQLNYKLRTKYLEQAKIAIGKHVNSLRGRGYVLPSPEFQSEIAVESEYQCFDGVKTMAAYKSRFLKLLKGLKEASDEGVLFENLT